MSEDLWKRVEAAYHYAPTREKAIAEADRIFRKTFRDFPGNYISEANCDIRLETLTFEKLGDLQLRHTMDTPHRADGTIVIVEHEGIRYVVDGTKRINKWKNHKITGTDQAVIITRKKIERSAR